MEGYEPFYFLCTPDTGCTRTVISENVLTEKGIPFTRLPNLTCIAANNASMECPGEITVDVASDDGNHARINALISSDCSDEIFVSWHDLVALQVLPLNFPRAIPSSLPRQEGADAASAHARVAAMSTNHEEMFRKLKEEFADVLSEDSRPRPSRLRP